MLGGTQLTSIIGAGVDNTDHDAVKAMVRALCNAGVAVLLIQPGTKEPHDARTGVARNKDDREAREAAREAGRRDWERVKAPAGLHLATTDAALALRYLKRYIDTYGEDVAINLAIETGRSRLVVVDCDTAEQVAEFLQHSGAPAGMPPTVTTPGKLVDGTWVHSDGGHFYFVVPEGVDLPTDVGAMNRGETGYAVLWSNRYVLIPPSTRLEGTYETVGRDYPLPQWLHDAIVQQATQRRERAQQRADARAAGTSLDPVVDAWAASVTWTDILAPLGWVPTGGVDGSCGCPLLTAPGDHGSPKSATGHEAGCSLGRWDNDVNAPLHIWTDDPGEPFTSYVRAAGSSTLSKLQAIALTEYGGDVGAAMTALSLSPEAVTIEGVAPIEAEPGEDPRNLDSVLDEEPPAPTPPAPTPAPTRAFEEMTLAQLAGVTTTATTPLNDDDSDFPDVGVPGADGFYLPKQQGVPEMAPFEYWSELPPPEFIVDGLIEHGGLSCVIGAPGAGKSTVVIDMACHIATGRRWQGHDVLQSKTLYLPGEGQRGVVQRLHAWAHARSLTGLGGQLIVGRSIIQLGASREAWAELREYIAAQGIGLIIFDTFARMATNIEENSATDVGKAIKRFDQIRELTNCGVMVVHHTGKATPDVARGSSALNGALDSELLVTADRDRIAIGEDNWGRPLHLRSTKQKNAEQNDEEIDLMMVNHDGAPLITGLNGSIDPMQGEILTARPVPEPLIETAVRIRTFVDRFPEQGVTRTDIAQGVRPDPFTQSLGNGETRAWRLKVAEAVDRSLRWELLTTLSGTPSGARYIPGDSGIAAARDQAAGEIMGAEAT